MRVVVEDGALVLYSATRRVVVASAEAMTRARSELLDRWKAAGLPLDWKPTAEDIEAAVRRAMSCA